MCTSFGLARLGLVTAWVVTVAGCGVSVPSRFARETTTRSSPLGPSYVLHPLPSEDDSLLGRVLPSMVEEGRSLEEVARANPCLDKLGEPREAPLVASFEDAEDLSFGAMAEAALGTFGFGGDFQRATHFVYRLETERRIARTDTTEYSACCKEQDCGYGYVSALVFGQGEYATAEETAGSARVDVSFASAGGSARLAILHRRKVRGWVAALVTVTSPEKAVALGPLGAGGPKDTTIPEQVQSLYDLERVRVMQPEQSSAWAFADGRGPITENEFIRRFRKETRSSELDDAEGRKNTTVLAALGGTSALTLAMGVFAFTQAFRPCEPEDVKDGAANQSKCNAAPNAAGARQTAFTGYTDDAWYDPNATAVDAGWMVAGLLAAATGVGTGTAAVILYTASTDGGTVTDHAISDYDAKIAAERYNRAILRRTLRDVQRSYRTSRRETPSMPSVVLRECGP